jgi:hypothetical protein
MDSRDEIRIPGERLEHRGGIRLKHRNQPLPQCIQRGKRLPGNCRLDRLPDPFARIDLGAIGWLKHEDHIWWQHERLGGMTPGVIHQHDMQMLRVRLRKISEKLLHHRRIQPRKFHEVTGVGGGFYRPKDQVFSNRC